MGKASYVGIGLLLGALIGFAVGAFTAQDTSPEIPLPTTSRVESESPDEPDQSEEDEIKLEIPTTTLAPTPPPSGDSLEDLIANADVPDIPAGTGQITGKILTEAGEPVAGVEVSARSKYPDKRLRTGKSTKELIQDTIKYERWKELSKHETTTDAQGSYTIEGLHETEKYNLWASLDGWKIVKSGRGGRVSAGAEVDFIATQVFSVSVEVRMPDGSLAGDVHVYYSSSKESYGSHGQVLDGGKGEMGLSAEEWTFSGTYGENKEYSIEEQTVTIGPGSEVKQVVLQLKGSTGIIGTIKVSSSYQAASLEVYLIEDPPAEAPGDLNALLENGPESKYLWGGSHLLSFSFLDIDAGNYRLLLVFDDRIADWADVTVGENLETVDLELPEPKVDDYIVAVISAPDGSRMKDIVIRLTLRAGNSAYTSGADVVSGENNEYWIHRRVPDPNRRKKVTEWTYDIKVTHSTYGSLTKTVEHDDTSTQQFQFQEPANVTVTVSGFNEHESRKEMRWQLLKSGDSSDNFWFGGGGRRRGKSKSKSPFKFGPMQPGSYELILQHGTDFDAEELYRKEFIIQSGDNPIAIAMPQVHSVTVNCKDDNEARQLRLRAVAPSARFGMFREFESTADGNTTTFTGVSAGEYILETDTGRVKITVPTNGVVNFQPKEYDCMVISDIKSGGIIEGLGLMNDDKLIEIDGVEVSGADLFYAQYRISLSKEQTTWVVIRNGIRTGVTFNGKLLMEALENRRENGEDIDLDRGYQN